MNARGIGIISAALGMILAASTAFAAPMHHHHSHATKAVSGGPLHAQAAQAVSPFEAEPAGKRLHCELLGHNPLLPCPHHKIPAGEKDRCYLTSDCGGGPFPASPSRSVGDAFRYLIPVVIAEDDTRVAGIIWNESPLYDFAFLLSLDRPPRAL